MAEGSIIGRRISLSGRIGRALLLVGSALLLFAGVTKVEALQEFRDAIVRHELLGPGGATVVSLIVPWLEIALGSAGMISAMSERMIRAAALAVGAAFLVFSVYALLISFDPPASPVPCGCLASAKPVESWFGVAAVNGAVATMMCLGAITKKGAPTSRTLPTR